MLVKNLIRGVSYCAALSCLLGLGGCGRGGRETVEVQGTVTLDGQPVADAALMFSGPEGGSPATARTDATGRFTLRAVPGTNTVAVSKVETADPVAGGEDGTMPAGGAVAAPKPLLPSKYSDLRTSKLIVDVASGMADVALELMSE